MTPTPQELAEEFPERAVRIHLLMVWNPLFRRLFDEYHEANNATLRAESRGQLMCETASASMRRKRQALKDELARMIDEVELPS